MTADPPARMLCWGIKSSFLSYVRGSGPHRVAAQPREPAADGLFRFLDAGSDDAGALRFSGRVQIEAHGGVLRVDLADPVLTLGADGVGVLSVDDVLRARRIPLVRLRAAETAQADVATFSAYLLEPGESVFGENYPAGTAFDPVHLRSA